MAQVTPVLVVGAGPTGLTAAMELSRLGVPVRIVDKLTQYSTTSRALAVQARTVELFEQRGIAAEMLRLGNKGRATTIYSDGKTLGRVDLSNAKSPFNFILMLAQSETERLLREQVNRQGVTIEIGTELVAIGGEPESGPDSSPLTAVLKHTDGTIEELHVAYVIAADGAHSILRHTLQLEYPGKSLPHSYALADLHAESTLPDDELSVFLDAEGLLAIFPMGNRRFRLISTQEEQPQGAPDPTLETMQSLYDAMAHIPARLHDMIWSSHFRINSRMLHQLRHGRIFFGGDAAHIHSPAGGQGMNTGIQDMINLCWKLALVHKGSAQDRLLDTYEAERLPVIETLVKTTEGATDAFTSDSKFMHSLIRLAAPVALGSGFVQERAAKVLSQIGTNYADSPLTQKGRGVGDIHAGERFIVASGQPSLSPDRFTIVSTSGHSGELANALSAWSGHLAYRTGENLDGADDAHVLVRPDGHIALVASGVMELQQWFQDWMPR